MLPDYFEEFGHKCKLHFNHQFDEVKANKNRFQLWFIKNSVISKNLILHRSRPRSFAALRNEILCQLEHYPYALHPFSYISFYAELVWMFVVFITLVSLPFDVFKYTNRSPNSQLDNDYLLMVISTVCILDCIRRFFTGYLIKHDDRDEIILDFRRISINYIKTYFFIDILPSLATFLKLFFLVSPTDYIVVYESIAFLKFFRLSSMLSVFRNVMHFYQFRRGTITSIVEVMQLIFIVHWVACFSVLPACIERYFDSTNRQWIDTISLPKMHVLDKYIFCLHRSTSILTGTGYQFSKVNDKFPPRAVNDMLYTIFTAILGHILSLILIGKVYVMVQGIRGSAAAYETMPDEVSQFMNHHSLIQKNTEYKIKTYYGFKYEHSFFKENAILGAIPNELREQIMLHCAKLVLQNVHSFKQIPEPVVAILVNHLEKDIVLSGDVIYRCNDEGYSMFFIESGTIAGYTCNGSEMNYLEDGSQIDGLISSDGGAVNQQHEASRIALETSEIFELKSKDYYALMDYCPDLIYRLESVYYELFETAIDTEGRYDQLLNKEFKLKVK